MDDHDGDVVFAATQHRFSDEAFGSGMHGVAKHGAAHVIVSHDIPQA